MPIRRVIWDFDGTLADSLASSIGAFNRLAPRMGFRPVEDAAAARAMTTRQFLKHHGISPWRLARFVRAFHAEVSAGAGDIRLFAGVPAVLDELRRRGIWLGVLSSNREDNIRRTLRANAAEGHFASVEGYPRLFGKAKALRRILRREGAAAAEVLYVGDEVRDVEAAQRAGVAVAAVAWGFQAETVLRAAAPEYVLRVPNDLLTLVE